MTRDTLSSLPVSVSIVRGDALGGAQRGVADYLEVTGDTLSHVTVPITSTIEAAHSAFGRHGEVVIPKHAYPGDSMDALAGDVGSIALAKRAGVIVGWQHPADVAGIRAGAALDLPVVMHERHVPDTHSPETEAEMQEIIDASYYEQGPLKRIIYAAEFSRRLHEDYGVNPKIATVIPAGIDLARFQRNEEGRRLVRAELGLQDDDMLIGVVTQDRPEKDPEAMLEIATRVIDACRREGQRIPHFAVVGYGFEPDSQKWVDELERRRIAAHVHLLGTREDMPNVYSAMDVNFLPSKAGLALTAIEGYACGVPFVGTRVGDNERNLGRAAVLLPSRGNIPLGIWRGVDAFVHELLDMRVRLANPDVMGQTRREIIERARQHDRTESARRIGETVMAVYRGTLH